ncbi:hypothetical protein WA158_005763 [Blastocystis sp. Blastoise]
MRKRNNDVPKEDKNLEKLVDKYVEKRKVDKAFHRTSTKHQRTPYKSLDPWEDSMKKGKRQYDEDPEGETDHESKRWRFKLIPVEDFKTRQKQLAPVKKEIKLEKEKEMREKGRFKGESLKMYGRRINESIQKDLSKEQIKIRKSQIKKSEYLQKRKEKMIQKKVDQLEKKEELLEEKDQKITIGITEQVDRPPELNFKFKGGDKTRYYNYGIK